MPTSVDCFSSQRQKLYNCLVLQAKAKGLQLPNTLSRGKSSTTAQYTLSRGKRSTTAQYSKQRQKIYNCPTL